MMEPRESPGVFAVFMWLKAGLPLVDTACRGTRDGYLHPVTTRTSIWNTLS